MMAEHTELPALQEMYQRGANLNLVVPSDPYAINAPHAVYAGAYSVLAHGPSERGELYLYSKADCRDDSCMKVSPQDLADYIKKDPQYHAGQPVVLFSCNTGKWGKDSYAQALANTLGADVVAPSENVVAVRFDDQDRHHFDRWVVAKESNEVAPKVIKLGDMEVWRSFDLVVKDPDGKEHFIDLDTPGAFVRFQPVRERSSAEEMTPPHRYVSVAPDRVGPPAIKGLALEQQLAFTARSISQSSLSESDKQEVYTAIAQSMNRAGLYVEERHEMDVTRATESQRT